MFANVAAAAVLLACGNFEADSAKSTTGPTQQETAEAFFDRFPSRDYETFAEAEAAAGFHIPRPAAEFPNLHGNTTHLQWLPNVSAPVSKSYYGPFPVGTQYELGQPIPHIQLRVAVSGLFDEDGSDGDAVMMRGEAVRIGGKDGWLAMSRDGLVRFFNYSCGKLNGETLWCIAAGRNEVDRGTFDRFIDSLR
jgi:hypothetical protein